MNQSKFKKKDVNFNELVGKKIGHYTVLSLDDPKFSHTSHNGRPMINRKIYYKCQCDCGNIESIRRETLLDPSDPHMCAKCRKKKREDEIANNIINNIFGDFKVIKFDHKDKYGGYFYKCQCTKCGGFNIKSRSQLISNRDCECLKCESAKKVQERAENVVGQQFGDLVVIEFDHRDKNNRVNFFKCKCSKCGHEFTIKQFDLTNGSKTECSVCKKKKAKEELLKDIIGKKFGKLTVISINEILEDTRVYYNCKCDCGHNTIRERRYIKSNPNPCCEECTKKNKYGDMNDIVGKTFGKLTVLKLDEKINGEQYYKCFCSGCKRTVRKIRRDLINGVRLACQKCLAEEAGRLAVSDIIEKKFGRLTVVSIEGKHDNGAYYYNCQCECGNEEFVVKERRSLLEGKDKDLMCSKCKTEEVAKDIVGMDFGNIKVLKYDHANDYGAIYYKCHCYLCGKPFDGERQAIKSGKTKQCPECTKRLQSEKFQKELQEPVGKKYGKLLVLGINEEKFDGKHYWYKCQCECENIVDVERLRLINGEATRCNECYWKERLKSQIEECINQKFGRLTVVSFAGLRKIKDNEHEILYNCKCDCDGAYKKIDLHTKEYLNTGFKVVSKKDLKSGAVKSCGCLYDENLDKLHTETNVIHNMYDTAFYQCYYDMLQRCTNPNHPRYKDYGGRGITVCEQWMQPAPDGFLKFKEDMYEAYKKHKSENPQTTIERKDNNLGYSPENCVWEDMYHQSNNTRRNNFYLYEGNYYTIFQLINNFAPNLTYDQLYARIKFRYNDKDEILDPEIFRNKDLESPIIFINKEKEN